MCISPLLQLIGKASRSLTNNQLNFYLVDTVMTDFHQKSITSSIKELSNVLVRHNDIFRLVDFTERSRSFLEGRQTEVEKNKTFLLMLSRRPDAEFGIFLNVLKQTGQFKAAMILERG